MGGADGERESFGDIGIVGVLVRVLDDALADERGRIGQILQALIFGGALG